jgi:hypothetical protein
MLRVSLWVLGACAGLIALLALGDARPIAREARLAALILDGGTFEAGDVAPVLTESQARHAARRPCAAEGYLGLLALAIWTAEAEVSARSLAKLDADVRVALDAARTSIRCDPLQPLGWIGLARFLILSEGYDERVSRLLTFSRRVAPREAWASFQRAAVMSGMISHLGNDDRQLLLGELRDLAEAGAEDRIAWLVRQTDRAFQRSVSELIGRLPFAQQRRYLEAAARLDLDVSGLTVPRSTVR